MTIAAVLLAVLAFAIILWQEALLRKREATIEVLREEIDRLHELRCRSSQHDDACNCSQCR